MSNVTDQCRNTKKLNKLVQIMLAAALAEIKAKGVNPLVIETYRTRERQNYLYPQRSKWLPLCGPELHPPPFSSNEYCLTSM